MNLAPYLAAHRNRGKHWIVWIFSDFLVIEEFRSGSPKFENETMIQPKSPRARKRKFPPPRKKNRVPAKKSLRREKEKPMITSPFGEISKWLKGVDCKSIRFHRSGVRIPLSPPLQKSPQSRLNTAIAGFFVEFLKGRKLRQKRQKPPKYDSKKHTFFTQGEKCVRAFI